MKMRPAADDLLERVAITFNLAPLPGAHALYGMTAGRVVGVAQKLGIFGVLLAGPATAGRVAEQLDLQVAGTRLLCENLAGLGILDQDGHTFSVAKPARKWLDPASPTYVGTSELAEHLREAGFGAPRRTKVRRIPDQDLYQATAA